MCGALGTVRSHVQVAARTAVVLFAAGAAQAVRRTVRRTVLAGAAACVQGHGRREPEASQVLLGQSVLFGTGRLPETW